VKPADLLGLVALRTVHALECVEKQMGMHCSVAPARYKRAGKGIFTFYFYRIGQPVAGLLCIKYCIVAYYCTKKILLPFY